MNRLSDVIKTVQLSEKATHLTELNNEYVFKVDKKASKPSIKKAIELFFDTKVDSVNTCNYKGKIRKRGRVVGRSANWKKAVVKLKEGESLDII